MRHVAATLLVVVAASVGCTSQPEPQISTFGPRLGSADALASPGALSFRFAGLIGVDGLDREVPDAVLDPAGDGTASCSPGAAIAVIMPLTGEASSLGLPIRDAGVAAVAEFTAANPGCELEVKQFDTQTSDAGSLTAAKTVVADPSVIGVVGPLFSHEVDLIGDRFSEAGLAFASPSANVPGLVEQNSGFYRGLPNERESAESGANYLTERLGLSRICVVAQEFPETELAAATVREVLGEQFVACSLEIGLSLRGDYRAEVDIVAEARAEAVYFGGYAAHAVLFVRDLHKVAPDVVFMGWEGVLDGDDFTRTAADSGRGTLAVGSFLPTAEHRQNPAATSSVDGSSRFATEAYELATIMTQGVGSGAATDRASMRAFLDDYSGDGPIRRYGWVAAGELEHPELILYEVG